MTGVTDIDLLTASELADLERAAVEASDGAPPQVARLVRDFAHVYVEARVAGLCREGACELFADALARAGQAEPAP